MGRRDFDANYREFRIHLNQIVKLKNNGAGNARCPLTLALSPNGGEGDQSVCQYHIAGLNHVQLISTGFRLEGQGEGLVIFQN